MLISRTGKWKRYLVAGRRPADRRPRPGRQHGPHHRSVADRRSTLPILGVGLGMLMQNLVLAVQNTVQAKDIGTASASVAFFRSVGGAIGVSRPRRRAWPTGSSELVVEGLGRRRNPGSGGGSTGASMDLKDMPAPIRDIMRAAYGDATAEIFLISAIIGRRRPGCRAVHQGTPAAPYRRCSAGACRECGACCRRRCCGSRWGRGRYRFRRYFAEEARRRRQGRLRPPPVRASWTWTGNSSRCSTGSVPNPVSPMPPGGMPTLVPGPPAAALAGTLVRPSPARRTSARRTSARTSGREGRRPPAGPDLAGRRPARGRRRRTGAA